MAVPGARRQHNASTHGRNNTNKHGVANSFAAKAARTKASEAFAYRRPPSMPNVITASPSELFHLAGDAGNKRREVDLSTYHAAIGGLVRAFKPVLQGDVGKTTSDIGAPNAQNEEHVAESCPNPEEHASSPTEDQNDHFMTLDELLQSALVDEYSVVGKAALPTTPCSSEARADAKGHEAMPASNTSESGTLDQNCYARVNDNDLRIDGPPRQTGKGRTTQFNDQIIVAEVSIHHDYEEEEHETRPAADEDDDEEDEEDELEGQEREWCIPAKSRLSIAKMYFDANQQLQHFRASVAVAPSIPEELPPEYVPSSECSSTSSVSSSASLVPPTVFSQGPKLSTASQKSGSPAQWDRSPRQSTDSFVATAEPGQQDHRKLSKRPSTRLKEEAADSSVRWEKSPLQRLSRQQVSTDSYLAMVEPGRQQRRNGSKKTSTRLNQAAPWDRSPRQSTDSFIAGVEPGQHSQRKGSKRTSTKLKEEVPDSSARCDTSPLHSLSGHASTDSFVEAGEPRRSMRLKESKRRSTRLKADVSERHPGDPKIRRVNRMSIPRAMRKDQPPSIELEVWCKILSSAELCEAALAALLPPDEDDIMVQQIRKGLHRNSRAVFSNAKQRAVKCAQFAVKKCLRQLENSFLVSHLKAALRSRVMGRGTIKDDSEFERSLAKMIASDYSPTLLQDSFAKQVELGLLDLQLSHGRNLANLEDRRILAKNLIASRKNIEGVGADLSVRRGRLECQSKAKGILRCYFKNVDLDRQCVTTKILNPRSHIRSAEATQAIRRISASSTGEAGVLIHTCVSCGAIVPHEILHDHIRICSEVCDEQQISELVSHQLRATRAMQDVPFTGREMLDTDSDSRHSSFSTDSKKSIEEGIRYTLKPANIFRRRTSARGTQHGLGVLATDAAQQTLRAMENVHLRKSSPTQPQGHARSLEEEIVSTSMLEGEIEKVMDEHRQIMRSTKNWAVQAATTVKYLDRVRNRCDLEYEYQRSYGEDLREKLVEAIDAWNKWHMTSDRNISGLEEEMFEQLTGSFALKRMRLIIASYWAYKRNWKTQMEEYRQQKEVLDRVHSQALVQWKSDSFTNPFKKKFAATDDDNSARHHSTLAKRALELRHGEEGLDDAVFKPLSVRWMLLCKQMQRYQTMLKTSHRWYQKGLWMEEHVQTFAELTQSIWGPQLSFLEEQLRSAENELEEDMLELRAHLHDSEGTSKTRNQLERCAVKLKEIIEVLVSCTKRERDIVHKVKRKDGEFDEFAAITIETEGLLNQRPFKEPLMPGDLDGDGKPFKIEADAWRPLGQKMDPLGQRRVVEYAPSPIAFSGDSDRMGCIYGNSERIVGDHLPSRETSGRDIFAKLRFLIDQPVRKAKEIARVAQNWMLLVEQRSDYRQRLTQQRAFFIACRVRSRHQMMRKQIMEIQESDVKKQDLYSKCWQAKVKIQDEFYREVVSPLERDLDEALSSCTRAKDESTRMKKVNIEAQAELGTIRAQRQQMLEAIELHPTLLNEKIQLMDCIDFALNEKKELNKRFCESEEMAARYESRSSKLFRSIMELFVNLMSVNPQAALEIVELHSHLSHLSNLNLHTRQREDGDLERSFAHTRLQLLMTTLKDVSAEALADRSDSEGSNDSEDEPDLDSEEAYAEFQQSLSDADREAFDARIIKMMDAIEFFIDSSSMRIADFMRVLQPKAGKFDRVLFLCSDQLKRFFAKMPYLRLSPGDLQLIVNYLDQDRDGKIDASELRRALKRHRAREDRASPAKLHYKSKAQVDIAVGTTIDKDGGEVGIEGKEGKEVGQIGDIESKDGDLSRQVSTPGNNENTEHGIKVEAESEGKLDDLDVDDTSVERVFQVVARRTSMQRGIGDQTTRDLQKFLNGTDKEQPPGETFEMREQVRRARLECLIKELDDADGGSVSNPARWWALMTPELEPIPEDDLDLTLFKSLKNELKHISAVRYRLIVRFQHLLRTWKNMDFKSAELAVTTTASIKDRRMALTRSLSGLFVDNEATTKATPWSRDSEAEEKHNAKADPDTLDCTPRRDEEIPFMKELSILQRFEGIDSNKDGYLDAEEARAAGFSPQEFKDMDVNGDGKVDLQEFVAATDEDGVVRRRSHEEKAKSHLEESLANSKDSEPRHRKTLSFPQDAETPVVEARRAASYLRRIERTNSRAQSVIEKMQSEQDEENGASAVSRQVSLVTQENIEKRRTTKVGLERQGTQVSVEEEGVEDLGRSTSNSTRFWRKMTMDSTKSEIETLRTSCKYPWSVLRKVKPLLRLSHIFHWTHDKEFGDSTLDNALKVLLERTKDSNHSEYNLRFAKQNLGRGIDSSTPYLLSKVCSGEKSVHLGRSHAIGTLVTVSTKSGFEPVAHSDRAPVGGTMEASRRFNEVSKLIYGDAASRLEHGRSHSRRFQIYHHEFYDQRGIIFTRRTDFFEIQPLLARRANSRHDNPDWILREHDLRPWAPGCRNVQLVTFRWHPKTQVSSKSADRYCIVLQAKELRSKTIAIRFHSFADEPTATNVALKSKLSWQATHTFNGKMGTVCSDDGILQQVSVNSQAHKKAIKPGHKILNVGSQPFSKKRLRDAEDNGSDYDVTVRHWEGSVRRDSVESQVELGQDSSAPYTCKGVLVFDDVPEGGTLTFRFGGQGYSDVVVSMRGILEPVDTHAKFPTEAAAVNEEIQPRPIASGPTPHATTEAVCENDTRLTVMGGRLRGRSRGVDIRNKHEQAESDSAQFISAGPDVYPLAHIHRNPSRRSSYESPEMTIISSDEVDSWSPKSQQQVRRQPAKDTGQGLSAPLPSPSSRLKQCFALFQGGTRCPDPSSEAQKQYKIVLRETIEAQQKRMTRTWKKSARRLSAVQDHCEPVQRSLVGELAEGTGGTCNRELSKQPRRTGVKLKRGDTLAKHVVSKQQPAAGIAQEGTIVIGTNFGDCERRQPCHHPKQILPVSSDGSNHDSLTSSSGLPSGPASVVASHGGDHGDDTFDGSCDLGQEGFDDERHHDKFERQLSSGVSVGDQRQSLKKSLQMEVVTTTDEQNLVQDELAVNPSTLAATHEDQTLRGARIQDASTSSSKHNEVHRKPTANKKRCIASNASKQVNLSSLRSPQHLSVSVDGASASIYPRKARFLIEEDGNAADVNVAVAEDVGQAPAQESCQAKEMHRPHAPTQLRPAGASAVGAAGRCQPLMKKTVGSGNGLQLEVVADRSAPGKALELKVAPKSTKGRKACILPDVAGASPNTPSIGTGTALCIEPSVSLLSAGPGIEAPLGMFPTSSSTHRDPSQAEKDKHISAPSFRGNANASPILEATCQHKLKVKSPTNKKYQTPCPKYASIKEMAFNATLDGTPAVPQSSDLTLVACDDLPTAQQGEDEEQKSCTNSGSDTGDDLLPPIEFGDLIDLDLDMSSELIGEYEQNWREQSMNKMLDQIGRSISTPKSSRPEPRYQRAGSAFGSSSGTRSPALSVASSKVTPTPRLPSARQGTATATPPWLKPYEGHTGTCQESVGDADEDSQRECIRPGTAPDVLNVPRAGACQREALRYSPGRPSTAQDGVTTVPEMVPRRPGTALGTITAVAQVRMASKQNATVTLSQPPSHQNQTFWEAQPSNSPSAKSWSCWSVQPHIWEASKPRGDQRRPGSRKESR